MGRTSCLLDATGTTDTIGRFRPFKVSKLFWFFFKKKVRFNMSGSDDIQVKVLTEHCTEERCMDCGYIVPVHGCVPKNECCSSADNVLAVLACDMILSLFK